MAVTHNAFPLCQKSTSKDSNEPDDVSEFVVDKCFHGEVLIRQLLRVLKDLSALNRFVGRKTFEVQTTIRSDQYEFWIPVGVRAEFEVSDQITEMSTVQQALLKEGVT